MLKHYESVQTNLFTLPNRFLCFPECCFSNLWLGNLHFSSFRLCCGCLHWNHLRLGTTLAVECRLLCQCWLLGLKPSFHYPSWRPELTARVDGWPVNITRQHGPCWRAPGFHYPSWRPELTARVNGPSWRVMETGPRQLGPLTRAVNSGNGNRALAVLLSSETFFGFAVFLALLTFAAVALAS